MEENMAGAPQGENNGVPKQEEMKKDVMGVVAQVEAFLDEYMVTKAPFQIPMNGKEILVKIAPYLVIIGAVLFALSLPALLGLGALTAGLGMMGGSWGYTVLVSLIAGAVSVVLELKALSGLFKRTQASWRLVYYATLVSFVGSVLSFNFIGAVIGGVIGWYILFQVKELYKN
ncbi:MAG: hypothetical protein ACEQSB_04615 [Undibacterium sp.]